MRNAILMIEKSSLGFKAKQLQWIDGVTEENIVEKLFPIVEAMSGVLLNRDRKLIVAKEDGENLVSWFSVRFAHWMFDEAREDFTDEDREHPFCYTTYEDEIFIRKYTRGDVMEIFAMNYRK